MTRSRRAGLGCLLLPALLTAASCGGSEEPGAGDSLIVFERTFRQSNDDELVLEVDRSGAATLLPSGLDEDAASPPLSQTTFTRLRRALRDMPSSDGQAIEGDRRPDYDYVLTYRGTTLRFTDKSIPSGLRDAVRILNGVMNSGGFA